MRATDKDELENSVVIDMKEHFKTIVDFKFNIEMENVEEGGVAS